MVMLLQPMVAGGWRDVAGLRLDHVKLGGGGGELGQGRPGHREAVGRGGGREALRTEQPREVGGQGGTGFRKLEAGKNRLWGSGRRGGSAELWDREKLGISTTRPST